MIIHKCDICKKEMHGEDSFIIAQMPINKYVFIMNNGKRIWQQKVSIELSNLEICYSCASHIADYLNSLGVQSYS